MARNLRVPAGTTLVAALLALGASIATLSSGGCNGSTGGPNNTQPSPSPPPPTNWAVFVYASGRNLSSAQTTAVVANLTSTSVGTTAQSPPFFIETAHSGINEGAPPFTSTKRFFAVSGGSLQQVADLGNQPLTDPNELANFLGAAHTQIPSAVRYCLVLEGPGAFPFLGLGADTAATNSSNLDLAAFDNALTTAGTATGLVKFDLIVLDMPQGATAEALSVLGKHARWVVALEAGAPSTSFDYGALASALSNNANVSAQQLAQTVAASLGPTVAAKAGTQKNETVGMSFNLQSTATIDTTIDTFASALVADLGTSAATLPNVLAAVGSARAASGGIDIHSRTDLVDLKSFALTLASVNTQTNLVSSNVVNAANALAAAITSNVSIATIGSDYPGLGGLAVYFPANSRTMLSGYSTVASAFASDVPTWPAFLAAYHAALSTGATTPAIANFVVPSSIAQNTSYSVTATITPANMIHDVTLLVTQVQGGQNVVLYSQPLGPPDAQSGNITASAFMDFVAANAGTDGPFLFPLRRETSGASPRLFAVDCDQDYTTAAGTTTVGGYVKVEVAGVGSLTATSWVPFELNGAVGRNDRPLVPSTGVTYTLFPRQVVVDSAGNISALSQTSFALRSTSGPLTVSPNQLLNQTTPYNVTIWLVAQTYNGDLAVARANATVN